MTSEISCESDFDKLHREIDYADHYDLHNILRQRNRLEWCEWYLNIIKKIAENFHHNSSKLKLSSSFTDKMVKNYFKTAQCSSESNTRVHRSIYRYLFPSKVRKIFA